MDSVIERKTPWLKIVLIGTLLVAGLTGFYNMVGQTAGASYNVSGDRLTIATVNNGQFDDSIALRGNIIPAKSVYLDAIEGGRVEQIFVEEGAQVKAGQKILELSNSTLQLDVISREAQISEQLNNLHNTRLAIDQNRLSLKRDLLEIDYQLQQLTRQIKQNQSLLANKLISKDQGAELQEQYDYMKKRRALTIEQQVQDEKLRAAQIEQLEGSVEQLNRNLSVTRKNLEHLVVRAPVDGLLSSLNADIGESKSRGGRLGQVDIVNQFKVTASVDEFYVSKVRQGQNAQFNIGNKSFGLVLSKVYAQISGGQFEVDFVFGGETPQNIRRGQSLQLNLQLGASKQGLLVNNGGFYQDTAGKWAFVIDASGKQAMRTAITTGRRNNRHIEVLSGLKPGDQVVVSSYGNFAEMTLLNLK